MTRLRRLISHRDQINRDPDQRSRNNRFEQDFHRFLVSEQNDSRRADVVRTNGVRRRQVVRQNLVRRKRRRQCSA